jgi:hypothetical protein
VSKNTIFGEEHFIDTQMIKLMEQRSNAIDNYVFEQMENTIKGTLFVEMPKVEIDKEKLKKWVVLCSKLENIEHSELVDMATKKKIVDLKTKLEQSQKEKELDNTFWKQECDSLQKALAEKEKELNDLCQNYDFQLNEFSREIYRLQQREKILEQQLAEKEKELENYKLCRCVSCTNEYEFMLEGLVEDLEKQIDKDNQAKTDFAIEQLEKVKDDFFDVGNGWWLCFRDGTQYMTHNELEGCVKDVIDNQIKELKEGK